MSITQLDLERPTPSCDEAAASALSEIRTYLDAHQDDDAQVVRLTIDQIVLPKSVVVLLASLLEHTAAHRDVSVLSNDDELTTQQAADLLRVSRPFLIGLLDAGEIEYRMVGSHRRVSAASLARHRAEDDRRRLEAARALTALSDDLDLE